MRLGWEALRPFARSIICGPGLPCLTPPPVISLRLSWGGHQAGPVTKLCIFTGMTVGGYVAGYLSSDLGLFAEVIVSGLGSMVGVYLGWKLAKRIER